MLAVFGSKDEHLVDTGGRAYRGRASVQQLLDAGLEAEKVKTGTIWMGIDKVSARFQCMTIMLTMLKASCHVSNYGWYRAEHRSLSTGLYPQHGTRGRTKFMDIMGGEGPSTRDAGSVW